MVVKKTEPMQIDRIESGLKKDLREAQEVRADLLVSLSKGQDVSKQLDEIDVAISATERQLGRINDARRESAKRNSTDAKKARHEAILDNLKRVSVKSQQFSEAARHVLLDVAALSGALATLEDQRREITDLAFMAVGDSFPDVDDRIGLNQTWAKLVDALALPGAFAEALWRARMGEVGVHMPSHWVQVAPIRIDGNVEDQIARQLDAIEKLSQKVIKASEYTNLVEEK